MHHNNEVYKYVCIVTGNDAEVEDGKMIQFHRVCVGIGWVPIECRSVGFMCT